MRTVFLTAIVFSAILTAFAAPTVNVAVTKYAGPVKPHSYIIKLKPDVSLDSHIAKMLSSTSDAKVTYKYKKVFRGYAVKLKGKDLDYVRRSSDVERIFENGSSKVDYGASKTPDEARPAAEHISRRANRNLGNGSGVDIYIISTGVNVEHECFHGRAHFDVSFDPGHHDHDGYGTHVAGVAAGMFPDHDNLATGARIISVRIANRAVDQSRDINLLVRAIRHVVRRARETGRPSIANMPFFLPSDPDLEQAMDDAVTKGIHFTFAAGDLKINVDNSIAWAQAFAVGAVDSSGHTAGFSGYGEVITVWAPGVNIKSAWIGSPSATKVLSNTGIASAYVAGVLAVAISRGGNKSPIDLYDDLLDHAPPFVIGAGEDARLATPWW